VLVLMLLFTYRFPRWYWTRARVNSQWNLNDICNIAKMQIILIYHQFPRSSFLIEKAHRFRYRLT
jgi:hypothetical protein